MPEKRFTGCRTNNKRSDNRRNMGPKDKERATVRSTRTEAAEVPHRSQQHGARDAGGSPEQQKMNPSRTHLTAGS